MILRNLAWFAARQVAQRPEIRQAVSSAAGRARQELPHLARKAGEASRRVAPPGGPEAIGRALGRAVGRLIR